MVVLVNDSHLLDLGVERELSSEMDVESGEKSLLAHVETGSEDMQWKNGASGGCGSTKSKKEATDEEKKKFGRAVEIVHKLVSKAA